MVARFSLGAEAIQTMTAPTVMQLNALTKTDQKVSCEAVIQMLLYACQSLARTRLFGLVESMETRTTWTDLVLPPQPNQMLQQIVATAEQLAQMTEDGSLRESTYPSRGITCLFYGPSGTGKTTAAEILANHLQIDLYRIGLSELQGGDIRETKKNVDQVFDAAETAVAVLLLDEAEVMLGTGPEMEHLLQRMAQYSGLAILSTHLPNAPAPMMSSRIQFIVPFDYPTPEQRMQIWQDCYPATTPTQDLSYPRLAQLNASTMNIRKIAFEALISATAANEPVQMKHILQEAQSELLKKAGLSPTEQEVQGWG
jgi:SpoVK/Ycf46/Vps4 family AAA+-type ATPase